MKIQIDTLTAGQQFKYCGRIHTIISITHRADGSGWDVVTDKHPMFHFPVTQMVTEV